MNNLFFKIKAKISDYLTIVCCRITNIDNVKSIRNGLKFIYFIKSGRKLNLQNPVFFTEKIQTYKLYMDGKGYEKYVDKVAVRKYIADRIGYDKLIPVIGTWTDPESIDFNALPDSFVIKTNHGAGMNIIVRDKKELDLSYVKKILKKWLNSNYSIVNGFELQYKNVSPLIYIENYMSSKNGDLTEYKFLCFNGEPYYCMVDSDRFGEHRRNIYDLDWILQDWNIGNFENTKHEIEKPQNFADLIKISQTLCSGFSHVRVDLYNIDGNIYFSELTFTTGSGYSFPTPKRADRMLGDLWKFEM